MDTYVHIRTKGRMRVATRLRDLGISIGTMPTGSFNAITDVPDILVGQITLNFNGSRVARTGVTVIVPRAGAIWGDHAFAGYFSFNGCGEMTGLPWVEESGTIHTPLAITNTDSVGTVRDAVAAYPSEGPHTGVGAASISASWLGSLPVVAETWDGWLNDINAHHVKKEHVFAALTAATGGPVLEGNVGGGTGMICHEFKGGIGTSSRLVSCLGQVYTVGVLVQCNYGERSLFHVDGVPVGRELGYSKVPNPWNAPPQGGSIIIIVATDAPLLPTQCTRLAKRATVGLARTGGTGHNGSGDIFLAFSTGNHVSTGLESLVDLKMIPNDLLNPFFNAVAEATEESIVNALVAASTMTGWQGHRAYALPHDELQRIVHKYRPS
jgi:D-aminopeptidase